MFCACAVGRRTVPVVTCLRASVVCCASLLLATMTIRNMTAQRSPTVVTQGLGCLKSVLIEACVDGRLVRGVYQAAQVLEKNPGKVMLCVLPQNHLDDAEVHLHSILIEAYCLENSIPFIKVDNEEKLTYLLSPWFKHSGCRKTSDIHCLLVKNPELKTSQAAHRLLQFYKETYSVTLPLPVLELPV